MRTQLSKNHINNRAHNWLVYKIGDKFLLKYKNYFKGVIYDFGCGDKPYQEYFESLSEKYIGVDWPNSIHELNADIIADLNKPLPIESNSADTIVSLSVMEHLYEPQVMLNEAYRILKNGGHMVLQVPFMWHVHEAPHDYFRYTKFGLNYMFKKAGFTDIKIEASAGFWSMWFLKLNYQLIKIIRGPRLLRGIVRLFLTPILYINLYFAEFMDRIWFESSQETQGYYVIAMK